MNTSKPIAGISYNSPEFLKNKIDYWKSSGFIEFGMWIKHFAEDEQGEKKDHYHVYLKPAKLIQTMELEDDSCEIDPTNDKPLKLVGLSHSKVEDWLAYTLHDPRYLAEKGLERVYTYTLDEYCFTCEDTFNFIVTQFNDSRKSSLELRLLKCIERGMTWQEIVKTGLVPIRHITGALIFYKSMTFQMHELDSHYNNEIRKKMIE